MPDTSVQHFVKGQALAYQYAARLIKEVRDGKRTLDSTVTELEVRRDERIRRFHELNFA